MERTEPADKMRRTLPISAPKQNPLSVNHHNTTPIPANLQQFLTNNLVSILWSAQATRIKQTNHHCINQSVNPTDTMEETPPPASHHDENPLLRASNPHVSTLEQDVLDEYARLLGNVNKVCHYHFTLLYFLSSHPSYLDHLNPLNDSKSMKLLNEMKLIN